MHPDPALVTAGQVIFFNGIGLLILIGAGVVILELLDKVSEIILGSALIGAFLSAVVLFTGMAMWGNGASH